MLTDKSRAKLLALFPPAYKDVIAHHVTVKFGIKDNEPEPDMPETIQVTGIADDGEKIQGLRVEVNGSSTRGDGQTFHITWSLDRDKGAKPVDTNSIMHKAKDIDPVDIEVIPCLQ